MAGSIYVTSTTYGSGKTAFSLGLINVLERTIGRVAYFKPISELRQSGVKTDVQLVKQALNLPYEIDEMAPVTKAEARAAYAAGTFDEVLDRVIDAYEKIARRADFVVIDGTDYEGAMATFEFNINAELAKNLAAPTLLVADAKDCFETTRTGKVRDPQAVETMLKNIRMVVGSLKESGCEVFGLVLNRANPDSAGDIQHLAADPLEEHGIRILGTIPRDDRLVRPTFAEVVAGVDGLIVSGEERKDVVAQDVIVAAMGLENAFRHLKRGSLVLVPADRNDLVLGVAAAYLAPSVPTPAGMILTGGLEMADAVRDMVRDLTEGRMPIAAVRTDTYQTALKVSAVKPRLEASQRTRIEVVKGLVESHVDVGPILRSAAVDKPKRGATPKQFMHKLVDIARSDRRTIVLPEGTEERILRATEVIVARGIADVVLLGERGAVTRKADALGLDLGGARIVDPTTSEWREPFAREYQKLRAKKNPTFDHAYDLMADTAYFGTMMVQLGHAHGMVSGAATTTAATLRPALEFVKTREGYSIASSVFFMLLPDSVLVYGDCAVNPNPTAEHLADIALASAETAAAFDVEPRVAMLSYSTGDSGHGSDVQKVRDAARIVRERNPELAVEGPIQYDAAIDPDVARTKLPNSAVAGRANVFIFPDLDSGNNTYKAVQRAAKAVAVGPVMQGLNKPVNDLSRGCSVVDIVNTVAITAVQSQGK